MDNGSNPSGHVDTESHHEVPTGTEDSAVDNTEARTLSPEEREAQVRADVADILADLTGTEPHREGRDGLEARRLQTNSYGAALKRVEVNAERNSTLRIDPITHVVTDSQGRPDRFASTAPPRQELFVTDAADTDFESILSGIKGVLTCEEIPAEPDEEYSNGHVAVPNEPWSNETDRKVMATWRLNGTDNYLSAVTYKGPDGEEKVALEAALVRQPQAIVVKAHPRPA